MQCMCHPTSLAGPFTPNGSSGVFVTFDARNASGETPLHVAASQGYTSAVQALLDAGSNIEAKDLQGRTPLHRVVEDNARKAQDKQLQGCIVVLLEAAASVEARDKKGETPLECAARLGMGAFVRQMKKASSSK
ncbi:hypothetical protein CYMTET_16080 [Cymbomonas tetramitiformis]|uniref:Uncharacterized protein n=1 Tax=Cymbomonas tetramitiformis TaxID=36881 RepID=A0AAE0L8P5_9CHLO|nr:hypothetical protein CYMTET_16080 [Cymbomonas tetramitiformis]